MKTYFMTCLLSPIWLPLLVCSIVAALKPVSELLTWIAIYWGFSLVFGGVQYLIALVIVWKKIDFNSQQSIIAWCLKLPVIFTPIQMTGMSLFLILDGFKALSGIFAFAVVDLLFGYAYVLVWLMGYTVLQAIMNFRERRVSHV